MATTDSDIVKYPLMILRTLRLYSKTNVKGNMALGMFYSTYLMTVVLIVTMQFILGGKISISQLIENLECIFPYVQMVTKVVVVTYKHREFSCLVSNRKLFWKTGKCDKQTQVNLENFFQCIKKLQLLFGVGLVMAAVFITISALYSKSLALGAWYIQGYEHLYWTLYTLQIVSFPWTILFFYAFDTMFLALAVELIVQLQILSYTFERVYTINRCLKSCNRRLIGRFKSMVDQHSFLLRYTKDLQKFYSPIIAVECLTVAPIICGHMYSLLESKQAASTLGSFFLFLSAILQLSMFCVPMDYIISQATLIAHAVYGSKWYLANELLESWKLLPFVIQASQTQATFRAAGLFEVNSRLVITILKISWSTCAVMRALRNKS